MYPPQAQYTSDNDAGEAGTENENDEAESSENFSSESANKEDIDTDTFNEEYSISENSENNEESEREEESLPDITYEDGAPDETPSENYEYSEGGFSYYSIDDSNR